jgi:tetratricopeptide (TPR) repeat protein
MNKYIFLLPIFCLTIHLSAQPNIYSESDIEFQTLFLDAQVAKYTGDTEKEIELLKEVIKRDKQSDAAYFELSRAYLKNGNNELAQKNALKATSLDPSNKWYLLTLAEIYENFDQYNKAIDAYQSLISMDEDNPVLYHNLAVNQLHINMPDKAAATLERLQSKRGITEETSRRLFDIYSKTGKEEKALSTLQSLSNNYPDNERYLSNLAGYLHDLGREEEAVKAFKKVPLIDPNNATASIAINKAESRSMKKDGPPSDYLSSLMPLMDNMEIPLDTKIKELMPYLSKMEKGSESNQSLLLISENLIDNYPTAAKAHAVRGDVLFYSGDMNASEKSYAKAITLDDTKYTLWDQWMVNLWQNSNFEKLETVSYDALDYFPNQVNAFIIHALSLKQNDKSVEANSYLDEAKFVSGKNTILSDLVTLAQLWSDIENNDKKEVSTFINKIQVAQISNPVYLELIGDLYDSIGDKNNSKKFWQIAIDLGAKEQRLQKKIGV